MPRAMDIQHLLICKTYIHCFILKFFLYIQQQKHKTVHLDAMKLDYNVFLKLLNGKGDKVTCIKLSQI